MVSGRPAGGREDLVDLVMVVVVISLPDRTVITVHNGTFPSLLSFHISLSFSLIKSMYTHTVVRRKKG